MCSVHGGGSGARARAGKMSTRGERRNRKKHPPIQPPIRPPSHLSSSRPHAHAHTDAPPTIPPRTPSPSHHHHRPPPQSTKNRKKKKKIGSLPLSHSLSLSHPLPSLPLAPPRPARRRVRRRIAAAVVLIAMEIQGDRGGIRASGGGEVVVVVRQSERSPLRAMLLPPSRPSLYHQ